MPSALDRSLARDLRNVSAVDAVGAALGEVELPEFDVGEREGNRELYGVCGDGAGAQVRDAHGGPHVEATGGEDDDADDRQDDLQCRLHGSVLENVRSGWSPRAPGQGAQRTRGAGASCVFGGWLRYSG